MFHHGSRRINPSVKQGFWILQRGVVLLPEIHRCFPQTGRFVVDKNSWNKTGVANLLCLKKSTLQPETTLTFSQNYLHANENTDCRSWSSCTQSLSQASGEATLVLFSRLRLHRKNTEFEFTSGRKRPFECWKQHPSDDKGNTHLWAGVTTWSSQAPLHVSSLQSKMEPEKQLFWEETSLFACLVSWADYPSEFLRETETTQRMWRLCQLSVHCKEGRFLDFFCCDNKVSAQTCKRALSLSYSSLSSLSSASRRTLLTIQSHSATNKFLCCITDFCGKESDYMVNKFSHPAGFSRACQLCTCYGICYTKERAWGRVFWSL